MTKMEYWPCLHWSKTPGFFLANADRLNVKNSKNLIVKCQWTDGPPTQWPIESRRNRLGKKRTTILIFRRPLELFSPPASKPFCRQFPFISNNGKERKEWMYSLGHFVNELTIHYTLITTFFKRLSNFVLYIKNTLSWYNYIE